MCLKSWRKVVAVAGERSERARGWRVIGSGAPAEGEAGTKKAGRDCLAGCSPEPAVRSPGVDESARVGGGTAAKPRKDLLPRTPEAASFIFEPQQR